MEEIKTDKEIIDHLPELETAKVKHNAKFVSTVLATLRHLLSSRKSKTLTV